MLLSWKSPMSQHFKIQQHQHRHPHVISCLFLATLAKFSCRSTIGVDNIESENDIKIPGI